MTKRTQPTIAVKRGDCVLFLSPGVSVSPKDIESGFRWLETWDVLMPVKSYELLALDFIHEGCSTSDTLALIRDLRQLVYDERVTFARLGSSADALFVVRDEETCEDDDCPLPMLRAIWKAKPLLLALPESWVEETK